MADANPVPVTRTREFWILVGYAAVLGAITGLVAYAFLAIVELTTELLWPETTDYGFLSGEPWWILLMGAAGLVVGCRHGRRSGEPRSADLRAEPRLSRSTSAG